MQLTALFECSFLSITSYSSIPFTPRSTFKILLKIDHAIEVKQPAMFPAVYLIRRKLAFSLRPLGLSTYCKEWYAEILSVTVE